MKRLILATFMVVGSLVAGSVLTSPAAAQVKVEPSRTVEKIGQLEIEIVDLSPKFLDFYNAAKAVDPETRFAIWQARYGFAAVPPTPEGDAMVKQLLADAWSRYPAELVNIAKGAAAMQPPPGQIVAEVAQLLKLDRPARVRVIAYVGGFEDNAYTMQDEGVPTLALPIESSPAFIELVGRHEAAHAIHMLTAGLSAEYERPIARVIIEEGLAMHVTSALVPGRPETAYTERTPGWLAAAKEKQGRILDGLSAVLDRRDGETVFRYTVGQGSTGIERETYFAGWLVVGQMLEKGRSLAEIARIPESRMVEEVRTAIAQLQKKAN